MDDDLKSICKKWYRLVSEADATLCLINDESRKIATRHANLIKPMDRLSRCLGAFRLAIELPYLQQRSARLDKTRGNLTEISVNATRRAAHYICWAMADGQPDLRQRLADAQKSADTPAGLQAMDRLHQETLGKFFAEEQEPLLLMLKQRLATFEEPIEPSPSLSAPPLN